MTQVELVAEIGITQGYLSELEAGRRKGPVALHQKIANALGVPIDLMLRLEISPASVSVIQLDDWGPTVLAVNAGFLE